jgi:uncharacterized SAM-binding protein YcdF (DUF218 family)
MRKILIVNQLPRKSDVIIILSGDLGDRLVYGVKLYKLGYADKVLISGNNKNMIEQALCLGIPKSSIITEEQSGTTFENAKYSSNIIKQQGYKSALVVTSRYHTLRTGIIFRQFFKGIDLTICAVPYDRGITISWWKDRYLTRFLIIEYLKLIWYFLFEYSNKRENSRVTHIMISTRHVLKTWLRRFRTILKRLGKE